MKERIISISKKYVWILIAPIIVGAMLFFVYALKGIYPFGNKTISYYDMAQSVVPIYYHTFDVLHGKANLFFSWNASLGTSMGDVFGNYVLFPTNLFFLFVRRDNILNSMSYYLVIKIMLSAFTMTIYSFSKCRNRVLSIISAILYSSCGFVIQYYTSIYFLDVFLIFPLLVFSYEQLVEKNKKTMYIICLSMVFLCNVQMLFFVSVYLLIKTGLLVLHKDEPERGIIVCRVFVGSICAILCSSVSLLPMIIQTLESARISDVENIGFFEAIQTIFCENQQQKNFMLFGSEFVIPLLAFLFISRKWKKYISDILMILLLMIPILFEGVNMMWHMGTYQMFPMRFGFILSFECINLLLISIQDLKKTVLHHGKYALIIVLCLLPIYTIILYRFVKEFQLYGIRDLEEYKTYWIIIVLLSCLFGGIYCSGIKDSIPMFIGLVAIIQTLLGYYGFIGVNDNYMPECGPDIIYNSENVRLEMNELNKLFDRTKDSNLYLNANYPFITQTSSASGWMNGTSFQLVEEMIRMGYAQMYVRTLDCGGTALTDAMLGYKYCINHVENDNTSLYEDMNEKHYLYRCVYNIPFGFFLNDSIKDDSIGFEHQNTLYHALVDDEDDLFTHISMDHVEPIYNKTLGLYYYSFELDTPGTCIFYVYGEALSEDLYQIQVNGKTIPCPVLSEETNVSFPNSYRNGFLDCGTYNGKIDVNIVVRKGSSCSLQLGLMSLSKLDSLINNKREEYSISSFDVSNKKLTMIIETNQAGEMVLPIAYSKNWTTYVNEKKLDSFGEINDAFLAFNLEEGKNVITIKYNQRGFFEGILLGVVGIILCIFISKKDICNNQRINRVITILFYIVLFGFVLYIYINPISSNIYQMLKSHVTIKDIWCYYP